MLGNLTATTGSHTYKDGTVSPAWEGSMNAWFWFYLYCIYCMTIISTQPA